MTPLLKKAWEEVLSPMVRRPSHDQVAALCYRVVGAHKEVLLITSRGTGRWILPKGWLMADKIPSEAAAQEAWEEAGVVDGELDQTPIGEFSYNKELTNGSLTRCVAKVFPLRVSQLSDEFPEADQRRRQWVAPDDAADMVREPSLKKLLRSF